MNCSIEASKFEQVVHPLGAPKVPPTKSIGTGMTVLSGFLPTTSTITPCVGAVALILISDPPASLIALKLYCAGGLLATRMMLVCEPKVTKGSESVEPSPLIVMPLPLSKQLVLRVSPNVTQAPAALLMGPVAASGDTAGT